MPTYGYNPTIPASGNNPANDQPLMQTNFASIEGIISSDHYTFGSAGSNDGFHQKLTIPIVQGADPNLVAPIASLYTKAVAGLTQLFFQNGALASNVVQLTGNLVNDGSNLQVASQFTVVTPWGIILKFGLTQAIASGTVVNLPSGFPNAFLGVVITPRLATFAQSGAVIGGVSQFTPYQSAGGNQVFYYFAWGN